MGDAPGGHGKRVMRGHLMRYVLIGPSRKTHDLATLDQTVPILVRNAVGVEDAQPKDTLRPSKL